jgi:hypothetical protein
MRKLGVGVVTRLSFMTAQACLIAARVWWLFG